MVFNKLTKKQKKVFYYSLALVLIILIFKSPSIFQSLDVTDEGFHLSLQSLVFPNVSHDEISPLILMSSYMGGAWISILDHPSLVWARLGGILLLLLTSLLSFLTLINFFDLKKTFCIVTVTSLFLSSYIYNHVFHYYTFPAFLTTLWLFILSKILRSNIKSLSFKILSVLIGFLTVFIILSRFSLLLILMIPILVYLYLWITKSDTSHITYFIRYMIGGILIGIVLFALFYIVIDAYNIFINGFYEQFIKGMLLDNPNKLDSRHTISYLSKVYKSEYLLIIKLTFIASIVISIFAFVKKKVNNYLLYLMSISILIVFLIYIYPHNYNGTYYYFHYGFIKILMGLIILFNVIFLNTIRKRIKEQGDNLSIMLLASSFIMIINHMGSSDGTGYSLWAMWICLPLIFLLMVELSTKSQHTNNIVIHLKSVLSLWKVILILILISSIYLQFYSIYRDQPRSQLNTEFSFPALNNIYSSSDRVRVVDEVLFEVSRLTDKDDEILFVNSIPMFYYLTETKPIFGRVWLLQNTIDKIDKGFQDMIDQGKRPKLFVYSKINTRPRTWPNNEGITGNLSIAAIKDIPKLDFLKDKFINDLNYTLIFENDAFVIYEHDNTNY